MYQRVVEPRLDKDGLGVIYKIYGIGEDGLGYRYYTGLQKKGATRGKCSQNFLWIRKKISLKEN